jgi:hypothetical protein
MINHSIIKLEDCFDGSSVYCYNFTTPWTKDEIQRLASLGVLEYFEQFPKPFFRVRTVAGGEIKGIQGGLDCRVMFPKYNREILMQEFESFLLINKK